MADDPQPTLLDAVHEFLAAEYEIPRCLDGIREEHIDSPLNRLLLAMEQEKAGAITPEPRDGIRVAVTDLQTGEIDSKEIVDDFIVVCAGRHFVSYSQLYPLSGTTQLTIKRGDA
jgi:hypothetical protein